MGNNNYLIPANSKRSMLILSMLNTIDLIIFVTGCTLTFILLMTVRVGTLTEGIMVLLPALVTAFLVVPIPNQHNIRTLIGNLYNFYTKRKVFYWKGWCNSYEEFVDKEQSK